MNAAIPQHTTTRTSADRLTGSDPQAIPCNGCASVSGLRPQGELFAPEFSTVADDLDLRAQAAADLRKLLLEVFLHDEPAQRLLAIGTSVPEAHRSAWHRVTHTLLARRLALGSPAHRHRTADAHTLVWALDRLWDHPALQQRWAHLISRMSPQQCAQLTQKARRRLRQMTALH